MSLSISLHLSFSLVRFSHFCFSVCLCGLFGCCCISFSLFLFVSLVLMCKTGCSLSLCLDLLLCLVWFVLFFFLCAFLLLACGCLACFGGQWCCFIGPVFFTCLCLVLLWAFVCYGRVNAFCSNCCLSYSDFCDVLRNAKYSRSTFDRDPFKIGNKNTMGAFLGPFLCFKTLKPPKSEWFCDTNSLLIPGPLLMTIRGPHLGRKFGAKKMALELTCQRLE